MEEINNTFQFSSDKTTTIIWWWINTAKEYISHRIAEQKWIHISTIIHGDKQRIALFESLSPGDQRKYFPRMYEIFKNGAKGVDLINTSGVSEYLKLEFKESEFVYQEKLSPIIQSAWSEAEKILVWVQILPDLLVTDIRWRESDLGIIFWLRSDSDELREREEEYRSINHNHDTYVYSYMNAEIDFWKLPQEDRVKMNELSEQLQLPISKYLLHLLAKVEYNKAIESQLTRSGLKDKITLINTSTELEEKMQWLQKL